MTPQTPNPDLVAATAAMRRHDAAVAELASIRAEIAALRHRERAALKALVDADRDWRAAAADGTVQARATAGPATLDGRHQTHLTHLTHLTGRVRDAEVRHV